MSDLFGAPLSVINVGLAQFAGPIRAAGADVVDVEWAPPAHDEGIARALARRPESCCPVLWHKDATP